MDSCHRSSGDRQYHSRHESSSSRAASRRLICCRSMLCSMHPVYEQRGNEGRTDIRTIRINGAEDRDYLRCQMGHRLQRGLESHRTEPAGSPGARDLLPASQSGVRVSGFRFEMFGVRTNESVDDMGSMLPCICTGRLTPGRSPNRIWVLHRIAMGFGERDASASRYAISKVFGWTFSVFGQMNWSMIWARCCRVFVPAG